MEIKPGMLYRGRRRRRTTVTVLVFILVLLIAAAVLAFDSFQKYIVYEPDGLRVVFPILATPAPADAAPGVSSAPLVSAEIVVEEPSFDGVFSDAGASLSPVHALRVPADALLDGKLESYVNRMDVLGANALLLELKPESGRLVYDSGVKLSRDYEAFGAIELAVTAAELKAKNIYLIAELSCCVDELIATRNPPLALKDAAGKPWSDEDGRFWLDARNRNIRAYYTDLIAELELLGFDEVVLSNVALPALAPAADGPFPSDAKALELSPATAVGNLAVALGAAREETGVKVSVLCEASPSVLSGQDVELFLRVFDRVYCPTLPGTLESDRATVAALTRSGVAELRFVPMLTAAPEGGCWAVG